MIDYKTTVAYKITRQLVDHVYGEDQKITDPNFYGICNIFFRSGGLWKSIVDGDIDHIVKLEKAIAIIVKTQVT